MLLLLLSILMEAFELMLLFYDVLSRFFLIFWNILILDLYDLSSPSKKKNDESTPIVISRS